MYSVRIRNSEKVAVPRISPPAFAPATVFVRRIPKRISGSTCRRSHQPNAASSATDAAMTPIVRPEPQPYVPLWVIAYTSDTSAPVTSTAPRASNDFTLVSRLSSRRRDTSVKSFDALRSEEHTSELQSPDHLVCPLLLEKKNKRPPRRPHRAAARAGAGRGWCYPAAAHRHRRQGDPRQPAPSGPLPTRPSLRRRRTARRS